MNLYHVKNWYGGQTLVLRGAGDHILPTSGMVDLEFMLVKVPVVMKRAVVIARIKLNVISCYALTEAGWETILGGAHQSALVNQKTRFRFPLKICERAWWLKVTPTGKPKQTARGRKQTKGSGPAPMEVGQMSSSSSLKVEKRSTE